MTSNITLIICLVQGQSTERAFPVRIGKDLLIGDLKDEIKKKNSPEFDDITASSLELWNVNIPVGEEDRIQNVVLKADEAGIQKLLPTSKIERYFKEPTDVPDDHIHVIVKRPDSQAHLERTPYQAGIKRMREEGSHIKEKWRKKPALAISTNLSDMKEATRFKYGVQSYAKILEGNLFFVTRMTLFKNPPAECVLLCRPKRHGKTLLCSLTRYFYDTLNEPQFHQMFPGMNRDDFTPRPCSFMVLSMSFASLQPHDTSSPDCGAIFEKKFQNYLKRALLQFCETYDLRFTSSSKDALDWFSEVVDFAKELGTPMMIIVDEYDSSVNAAMMFEEAKPFRHYLRQRNTSYFNFFTRLKQFLDITGNRALIVGVAPIAIADYTSGFNVAYDITWESEYQDVCGVLVDDIEPVLQKVGIKHNWDEQKTKEVYDRLIDLYDGYHFGGDARIFNGGQLVNCLERLHKQNRFPSKLVDINTNLSESVLDLLSDGKNDQFYLLLIKLLAGPVEIDLPTVFTITAVREELNLESGSPNILLSLMVYYGALTSVTTNGYTYAQIPNQVARQVFAARLLTNLNRNCDFLGGEQAEISIAVSSFLTGSDVAPLIDLFSNCSVLPKEDHGDVVNSTESTFKTRFQVLILAGLGKDERRRMVNEFLLNRSNPFDGQADAVVIPSLAPGSRMTLIEFKNSRIADLKGMAGNWQWQVEMSREISTYADERVRKLALEARPYHTFTTIGAQFDAACGQLTANAVKLKKSFPGNIIVGFVIHRVGLHKVLFKCFDNM